MGQKEGGEKPPVKRESIPAVQTYNLSEFHKDLEQASKESKKSVINVLCRMLSTHGAFSDFGERHPEAYARLQAMRS